MLEAPLLSKNRPRLSRDLIFRFRVMGYIAVYDTTTVQVTASSNFQSGIKEQVPKGVHAHGTDTPRNG